MRAQFYAGLLLGLTLLGQARAAEEATPNEFFENKVRPILVDSCYSCHSAQSGKIKGGLRLDTRDGVLKGGDTGPAVVPRDVDHSLLIKAVRYTDDDLKMPPKNQKLSAEQIAVLESWVKMGAPDPRQTPAGTPENSIASKAKTHWAFQPIRVTTPPPVKQTRWLKTPVDNFILSKLEAVKLKPSPIADKRTLIRRATFDLTGLPPTPEEVAAFEKDKSPDAYEKLVDQLLASPQYGERWGRHWLDVARYADTKGYVFEEDRHYAYAYTYRDYVIRSFNEDRPYDQFLKEQIAADLMTNSDKRSLAALGYLTLGRRFVNNIHDIIDDRIDVVCRGMMGLTAGCARCHDHKFDPIPTKDYYSLYGIFSSSMEPEEKPLLGIAVGGEAGEKYLAEHKKRVANRDTYKEKQEDLMAEKIRHETCDYMRVAYEAKSPTNHESAENLAHQNKLDNELLDRWMAGLDKWHTEQPAIFAPWFAYAALTPGEFTNHAPGVTAALATNTTLNPWVAHAFAGKSPTNMTEVAARYGKLFDDIDARWQSAPTNETKLADPAEESLRQILYAMGAPANLPRHEFHRLYDVATSQKMRELQRHIEELDASDEGAPPRAMAMVDKPDPQDVGIFIRGNSGNQGAPAPRRFLEILSGTNRQVFTNGSGRLELAEAIANTNNPLTARVLVNRVWLHHFGSPLVDTPSDFGLRSSSPTHPELLNYLAARFMADGWSIKKLHRLMMLSATYRQGSDNNDAAAKIDPGNQMMWRMNRERLEFEPMRDTLLAVSGRLVLKDGGHPVDILDKNCERRTVYGSIDRQNLPDLFRAFDFATPDTSSPRRFFTTVPQQALFLMNSPFIITQAKSFVTRPEFVKAKSDQEKLTVMFELAYQRKPTRDERKWAQEFLRPAPPAAKEKPKLEPWQELAQVILMSNELIYLD